MQLRALAASVLPRENPFGSNPVRTCAMSVKAVARVQLGVRPSYYGLLGAPREGELVNRTGFYLPGGGPHAPPFSWPASLATAPPRLLLLAKSVWPQIR